MHFTITSEQILGVCGFVASVWACYKIYKEIKQPNKEKTEMLLEHEKKLQNDNEKLLKIEEANKMILQCLLVIINHNITGNGINQLKDARDELQDFLIHK